MGFCTPRNHGVSDRAVKLLVGQAIVVVTLAAYSATFEYSFVNYDDYDYVVDNPHVRSGLTMASVRWAFTTFDTFSWHPLTWLSLQLNATLDDGGGSASGFHLTNVLLHAANALLLFLVFAGMTGAVWRSAVVAAMFALHPLHVESVAWVTERKDVLATLFWMSTLAAYFSYVHKPGISRYLLVAIALSLGLLAKPLVVTLPFVLLLLDYWPLRRWRPLACQDPESQPAGRSLPRAKLSVLLVEKIPLFVLALAASTVTFLAHQTPTREQFPASVRLANAVLSYVAYIFKTVWPTHLSPFYPHPGLDVSFAAALGAGILLLTVTVVVLGPGLRWPYLAVGWLWYLSTLVPMVGIVHFAPHAMADRHTYVPLIGLFLMLTWGVADLATRVRVPRTGLIAVTAVALIGCDALTRIQVSYWKNDLELWRHAITVTSNNAFAHSALGTQYSGRGKLDLAQVEFEKAVALEPGVSAFHYTLGLTFQGRGMPARATAAFRTAIELDPDNAFAHASLGDVLRESGQLEGALGEYRKASDLRPDATFSRVSSADVLAELGRTREAIAEYRVAIYHEPRSGIAHNNLAMALQADGQLEEAIAEYRRAFTLGYPEATARHQTCERLLALRPKFADLLAGYAQPTNNGERLVLADLCNQPFERCYARAAQLYVDAFAADPRLANDSSGSEQRLNAACAAALAGCGHGQDAERLEKAERAWLRGKALGWLQAELLSWKRRAARTQNQQDRSAVRRALLAWQRRRALEGVRDPIALEKLPDVERLAWRNLWQEVQITLAEAEPRR